MVQLALFFVDLANKSRGAWWSLDEGQQQLTIHNQRRVCDVSMLHCSRHTSKADESSAEEANSQRIQVQLHHPVP